MTSKNKRRYWGLIEPEKSLAYFATVARTFYT